MLRHRLTPFRPRPGFTIPRHTTELDVCRQFYEACDAVSNRLLDNFCGVSRSSRPRLESHQLTLYLLISCLLNSAVSLSQVDRIPKIVSLKCIVTEGGVEGAQRYSYTRRIAKQLNLGLLIDDTVSS